MMKKIGLLLASMMLAWSCSAIDYSLHMSDARVYRVALGDSTAPDATEMQAIGIRPGDFVVNTSDDTLYIMIKSNLYTMIQSDGLLTASSIAGDYTNYISANGNFNIGTNLVVGNAITSLTQAVNGHLFIATNLTANGATRLGGALAVTGAASFASTFNVVGAAIITGNVTCVDGLTVNRQCTLGAITLASNMTAGAITSLAQTINGHVFIATNLTANGNTRLGGSVAATGAVSFASTLNVVGATIVTGNVTCVDGLTVNRQSSLGGVFVASNLTANGDTRLGGTVAATGAVSFASTLNVVGATVITGACTAASFSGSGASLTALPAAQLTSLFIKDTSAGVVGNTNVAAFSGQMLWSSVSNQLYIAVSAGATGYTNWVQVPK